MGAGWADWRNGCSFVMWKPMGEGDVYGGSAELEAAMV